MWKRMVLAWYILWHGKPPVDLGDWGEKMSAVLGDAHTVAVSRAFDKLKNEPKVEGRIHMYSECPGSEKHKEVVEWANRYATKLGVEDVDPWRINFAIEYYVGKDKGLL